MDIIILQLFLLVCGALGVSVVALRVLRPSERPEAISPRAAPAALEAARRSLERGDPAYLKSRPAPTADLAAYLASSRRGFLKLYLRQIRRTYLRKSKALREFASQADAPELAFAVLGQSMRFQIAWWAIYLGAWIGLEGPLWSLAGRLLHAPPPEIPSQAAAQAAGQS